MCSIGQSLVGVQCVRTTLLSLPLPGASLSPTTTTTTTTAFKVRSTKPCRMKFSSVSELRHVGGSFQESKRVDNSLGHTQTSRLLWRRRQLCHAQKLFGGNRQRFFAMEEEEDDDEESFFVRLKKAWEILFPSKTKPSSNAEIAKQRLKMIFIADRCSVNDKAKRMIVNNIVSALSDFVEIESEEKVQLDVTSDLLTLGTVYSVTVPVRRVKPEYQSYGHNEEFVDKDLMTVDYRNDDSTHFKMLSMCLETLDNVNAADE